MPNEARGRKWKIKREVKMEKNPTKQTPTGLFNEANDGSMKV